jgi:hypothetical protein
MQEVAMPADATNHEDAQAGRTVEQVLGWLVAVVPAVVGFATIDIPAGDRAPQVVKTDAVAPAGTPPTQLTAAPPPGVPARD